MFFIKYWLVLIVVTLPWFIGGTTPFARSALLLSSAIWLTVAGIVFLKKKDESQGSTPLIGWFLVAGVIVTAFQLIPLVGVGQQDLDSNPGSLERSKTELAGLKDAAGAARSTVSVYPAATRQKLVDLIAAVAVFWASAMLFRRRQEIHILMGALVACGLSLSVFGVFQKLSWNGKLYWVFDLVDGGVPFGSYVNSNNCAGFLLITFSAAMYFVFYHIGKWDRPTKGSTELVLEYEEFSARTKRSLVGKIGNAVADMKPVHLYFTGAIATIVAGTVLTLSRGGMLALAGCFAISGIFLVRVNRVAGVFIVGGLIVAGLFLVSYADQSLEVQREIGSLGDLPSAASLRLDHWKDAVAFSSDHWLLGVGNGTYRLVSPAFQSASTKRTFAHAESVYVETLVEMGALGVLLIGLVGFAVWSHVRHLLSGGREFDRALGAAGLVCLVGQVLSAAFDFGIYQPANYVAVAAFLGSVVGRSIYLQTENVDQATVQKNFALQSFYTWILLVAGVAASLWAAYEAYGVDLVRGARYELRLMDRIAIDTGRPPSSLRLDQIERDLRASLGIRRDASSAHFYLGETNVFRERLSRVKATKQQLKEQISELQRQIQNIPEGESSGQTLRRRETLAMQVEALENVSNAEIWMSTELLALHQLFRVQQRIGQAEVDLDSPLITAWENFETAERLCNLQPKTQMRLAQLAAMVGKDQGAETELSETQRIDLAMRRTIPNAQLLFSAGFLMLSSGNQQAAAEKWRQCLSGVHEKVHQEAIIQQCLSEMPMRIFYEQVLPQNPRYLIKLARLYFRSADTKVPRAYLLLHIEKLIRNSAEYTELERIVLLAELAVLGEDFEKVSELYSKVESSGYPSGPWRSDYAAALIKLNQFDEATRQLKICQVEKLVPLSRVQSLMRQIRRNRFTRPMSR